VRGGDGSGVRYLKTRISVWFPFLNPLNEGIKNEECNIKKETIQDPGGGNIKPVHEGKLQYETKDIKNAQIPQMKKCNPKTQSKNAQMHK